MFIILLTFSENKSKAPDLMAEHKQWIKEGREKGLFLLVGSLTPSETINGGGSILAISNSREEVESYVSLDPFVIENVVKKEIIEVTPNQVDDRLSFLME